jgi:hypothetical protein
MNKLKLPNGKPNIIDHNMIACFLVHIRIITVEIIDLIEKQWSRFKQGKMYTIDNITYNDLIQYQYAKIKIINGIYWNSDYIDNIQLIKNLYKEKSMLTILVISIKSRIKLIMFTAFFLQKIRKKLIKTKG